ncbi:6,7-dimethyl-8-ribityllumazine synthase [Acidithiobacillus ferrivorans]|uniref:6,7-dimethyl-8-ribityllumazine synthase n=1 Tax=Acidithiobacillus ferrivorans TaxID=160808 RepID=UPI000893776B|nr:6,7-dimethyl-8-ribityllumazine synthase [Acidithiobacillus ferrivorans]MBU2767317.1 6,7-dimethyl-8-ribityllumazine synthase [Acidithiobacillus ferrivorans]OFA17711.1 6,7-dimethyl-8-ribityllumazine synthase [Acidithiobacillus ferrivorans]
MIRHIDGSLQAGEHRFALLVSRFNNFITQQLEQGAVDALRRHGAEEEQVHVVYVPGAYEMPLVAQKLARSGNYDAVICLGAVIRGSTPHFDYVAAEVSKGVAQVSMDTGVPVIFGVLTTDSIEQAIERAGTKAGNKGFDAAMTALEMVQLLRQI